MYPESEIEMGSLGESIRKFGSLNIWSTTFGSKMQPRGIRSGKILASWPTDNGKDVLQETFRLSAGTVFIISDIQLKWAMSISHITLLA